MTTPNMTQIPENIADHQSLHDEVRVLEQRKEDLDKQLLETHRAVEAIETNIFKFMSEEEEFRKREEAKQMTIRKKEQQKRIHENKLRAKTLRLKKILAELKEDMGLK